jgi:hypothetical protein
MMRQPISGVNYFGFVDASSLKRDSFTGAVAHAENERVILDHVVEIPAGTSNPAEATAIIASALKNYRIREAVGDRYALGFAEVEFARHGVTLLHSDRDRSTLYRECLPMLLSGKVRLLDNPKMVAQFAALETRALPGGNVRIDHPRSGSDDISNAVAGAVVTVGIRKNSSADNWLEYMRRQVEEPWRFRGNTDFDDARPAGPAFNWSMTNASEPLFNVVLPESLVPGQAGVRYAEGKPYIQATRREAKSWLKRPAVAALNETLAAELEENII